MIPTKTGAAAAVGLVCGLAAIPYAWLIRTVKRGFAAVKVPMFVKACVGGALLGLARTHRRNTGVEQHEPEDALACKPVNFERNASAH